MLYQYLDVLDGAGEILLNVHLSETSPTRLVKTVPCPLGKGTFHQVLPGFYVPLGLG